MMKSNKMMMLLGACALLCANLFAAAPTPDCGSNLATLKVGMTFDNPPFVYSTGSPAALTGFDIAIACELQKRIGYNSVSITRVSPANQFTAHANGTVSLLISANSIPAAGIPAGLAFVKYSNDSASLVINGSVPAGITPANALATLNATVPTPVVGYINGSREEVILGQFAALDLAARGFDNYTDAITALKTGIVTWLLLQGATANYAVSNNTGFNQVANVAVPAVTASQGLGIVMESSCCQLYANVAQAITDMAADGTLAALAAQFNTGSYTPVSGLTPAACASTKPNLIQRNSIATFIFNQYCRPCVPSVTP